MKSKYDFTFDGVGKKQEISSENGKITKKFVFILSLAIEMGGIEGDVTWVVMGEVG
jgi:hypothetical protein